MLVSLACIFLFAILGGWLFQKLGFPKIIGMLLIGIVIGPYFMNLIDSSILQESSNIRKVALVIILIKAGLTIKLSDFKNSGRSAVLLSFVPACMELAAYTVFAPLFFDISYSEAALMGSVLAAVSPAIVVPRMVELIEQKVSNKKKIPQLILAGASFDDVVVLVLFSVFLGLVQDGNINLLSFADIPISIFTSLFIGLLSGILFLVLNKTWQASTFLTPIYRYLILFSLALMLVVVEARLSSIVAFSGLLAILVMTVFINQKMVAVQVQEYSNFFSRLWIVGEIFLFVLVGSIVDVSYISVAGLSAVLLIGLTLVIRSLAVWVSVSHSGFTVREKVFCIIAYLPKATVQAAIGGIPLAVGLKCGQLILSVAVLGIVITAPLGAFLLDRYGEQLLMSDDATVSIE